jgi:hypothetical protein
VCAKTNPPLDRPSQSSPVAGVEKSARLFCIYVSKILELHLASYGSSGVLLVVLPFFVTR